MWNSLFPENFGKMRYNFKIMKEQPDDVVLPVVSGN